ncbi:hypothetical protein K438DRAFT_1973014 [Mycena galopus ATCC 62051]|nr:hypothetical protein K438DRAFT_1973014 [Mycena galopus ATCC 62051]
MAFLQTHPNFNKNCLMRNIASGLEYLHDLDPPVVHGDIKGANILIDNSGHACLADFGLPLAVESQALGTSSAGSTRGTLRWLSPEILDSSRKAERQTSLTKRDIYAFGCTILEIYTGNHPFPHLQDVEVIHNVVTKHERPEIPSNAVAQLKDLHPLLKRCSHNDPRQRPNATEIGNVLHLEPLEWKGAVGGPTSPFSMWRKLSAPLGLRSPPISPAPRSHLISSTTVQSPSAQGLGSGRSKEASRTIDVGLREEQERSKEASRTIDVGLREEQERSKEASRIIDAGLREERERKKRTLKILLLGLGQSSLSFVPIYPGTKSFHWRPIRIWEDFRKVFTSKYFETARLVPQLNLISLIKIILVVLQEEWEALETDSAESKQATSLTTEHPRLALSLSPLIAFRTSIRDNNPSGYDTRNDSSQVTQVLAACKNEIIALFEDMLVRRFLALCDAFSPCATLSRLVRRFLALCDAFSNRSVLTSKTTLASFRTTLRDSQWHLITYRHFFVTEAGLRAGTEFYITEFCGNSSQLSTWLPYLDNVQAIFFLAPLVFWQKLDEDPKVNRVQESIELWQVILSGNSLLYTTTLILLFNKKDLLHKQIDAGVKVNEYVPSYRDQPNDVVSVTKCM